MRAALGEAGFRAWDREFTLRAFNLKNTTVTDAETDTLFHLRKNFDQEMREIQAARDDGSIDEADCSALQDKLQTTFQDKMQAVFGEERYAALQGQESPAAQVRKEFFAVKPTDPQVAELTRAQKEWSRRHEELEKSLRQNPNENGEFQKGIEAADKAREDAYQDTLGASAYAEYKKQQDSRYISMKQYATAWGITDENVERIYQTIAAYERSNKELQAQVTELEASGHGDDREEIDQAIQQSAETARRVLQNYLGADRYARMEQNQIFPF